MRLGWKPSAKWVTIGAHRADAGPSRASARVSKSLGSTSAPGVLGCMLQLGDIAEDPARGQRSSASIAAARAAPRVSTGRYATSRDSSSTIASASCAGSDTSS